MIQPKKDTSFGFYLRAWLLSFNNYEIKSEQNSVGNNDKWQNSVDEFNKQITQGNKLNLKRLTQFFLRTFSIISLKHFLM